MVIAEVAIALAGFASIVVAIRGTTPSNWTRQDRFGLVNVFVPSVSVFFCALFPFPLYLTGWDEPTVWRVSSGLFGSTTLCYLVVLSVRQWGVAPRVPLLFWFFVASGYVLGATMMSLAFGVVFDAGPGILIFGLVWGLLAALAQMATFLMLATAPDDPGERR